MVQEQLNNPGLEGRAAVLQMLRNGNAVRVIILLCLVALFAVLTNGSTIAPANISNILIQSSIRGIAACGQAFVVLTGGLDLSVSGIVALASMVGGSLITANPLYSLLGGPINSLVAIAVVLLVGLICGVANGLIVSRLRLPSLIVTLGTWQVALGLAYRVTGSGFVDKLPKNIAFLGQGTFMYVPVPVLALIAVGLASYLLLHHAAFGAEVYSVGGNSRTAFISGVSVWRVRLAVFAIAGFFYGIGATIGMSRYLSATMAQASGLELSTIAAVAIGGVSLSGGRGTIVGVLIGTLIIGVIDNGLSVMGIGPAYQAIARGLIIVTAVAIDTALRR